LTGGNGDDTLTGGAGTDTSNYSTATAGVTVNLSIATAQPTVGAGTDTITEVENVAGSAVSFTQFDPMLGPPRPRTAPSLTLFADPEAPVTVTRGEDRHEC
jgi:hypothetical protein